MTAAITAEHRFLAEERALINTILLAGLPHGLSTRLDEAMRYVIQGGGKRLRPLLVFAAAELGTYSPLVEQAAIAVEYMHLYSLVHDDLPAMDNDDWRHGQLACHKVYGEAMAILVGDTLQALAFQVLAKPLLDAEKQLKMIALLAKAAGPLGMTGGQALDLDQTTTIAQLEAMHEGKTAALIQAAVLLGAVAAGVDDTTQDRLGDFGKNLGLLYQIQDDLLDIEGTKASLGKTPGKDERDQKPTYPRLMGTEMARKKMADLQIAAESLLSGLQADRLNELLQKILTRNV